MTYKVIGAAIEVHKAVGPGLLESVYHRCMEHELTLRRIEFETELFVPVKFKGLELDAELKCDMFVEQALAVELKSVKSLMPVNDAQLMTYMSLLNVPKGLLINFKSTNIFNAGQKTLVNKIYRDLPEH